MGNVNSEKYFPEIGDHWKNSTPEEQGLDSEKLTYGFKEALRKSSKAYWGEDYAEHKAKLLTETNGKHADVKMVGPFTPPSDPNGLVLRRGYLVAEFGDTNSISEVASVSKSFLSAIAGLSFDRGLIKDVHEKVCKSVDIPEYAGKQNSSITWHHLLQQTSEWDGSLFGKVPTGHSGSRIGEDLYTPGEFFEYNDVRVNLLSYSLLYLWKRSLAEVLKEFIMDPIGASDSWQWHGYRNSNVVIDGQSFFSVSGGAHWGGGVWMNSRDLARFGYLYLNNGIWEGERILSREWIEMSKVSGTKNYMYGYLWWLKHDKNDRQIAFAAQGAGGHTCTVIPDYEMILVGRWIEGDAFGILWKSILNSPKDVLHLQMPVEDLSRINKI